MVPPVKSSIYWENPDCKSLQDRQWFCAKHPQLALIPEYPTYEGPILQRLWLGHSSQWIVNIGGYWKLRTEIALSWRRLELSLVAIARKLLKHSEIHLSVDLNWLPLPSTRGYLHSHKSQEHAILCTYRSRSAFLGLCATISLGIILYERSTMVPNMGSPWIEYLAKFDGISHIWLEDLARTFVGNFSGQVSRNGTFIDVNEFTSFEMLRELLKVNVPVWIRWGKVGCIPSRTGWSIIDDHAPPTTSVEDILTYYPVPMSPLAHPRHSAIPSWVSRQLGFETWEDFFVREDQGGQGRVHPFEDWLVHY
ncbi:hypothetical protein M422DRAFT_270464 [Sphaerobolus stellatus SS14]|uniref:Uncharacterized protein n=1 Tax=Sphaerobolus stellatus (strain SS14) TaxID=990650 RepID=A0A0C9U272_SPHS4|nr:hypothetical protein M422DRAFT_270464 [Sphaerobolus stellatus SS14]